MDYRSSYTVEIADAKEAWETELSRLHNIRFTGQDFTPEVEGHFDGNLNEYVDALGSQLTQTAVIGQINTLLDEDAIIVGAAGSLPGDLQRMWASRKPNTYHMEYGYSCMGYEVAGALGAKLAEPSKEVYAMVGDGSYQMLHSELVTSLQENKKLTSYCLIIPDLVALITYKWAMEWGALEQSFAIETRKLVN